MSFLDAALKLAGMGFHVFPITEGLKDPPLFKGWQKSATRDEQRIKAWWAVSRNANIGISTTRFGDDEALLVVDVDNKGDKHGDETLSWLEFEGLTFPATYTQTTPTGGRHLFYRVPKAVKQGTNVLGPGLDIRSQGGYVVGAGSRVERGVYTGNADALATAPDMLVARVGAGRERKKSEKRVLPGIDPDMAHTRAATYLRDAPVAVEGAGGDDTTYRVACQVRELGVDREDALEVMTPWNERCVPPWQPEDLQKKIDNAYQYAQRPQGAAAPEALFGPDSEFNKLNGFAFVLTGGGHHILWETRDAKNRPVVEHLKEVSFHKKFAADKVQVGKRAVPITQLWMESDQRPSYDGIVFDPTERTDSRFYNLWKGFDPLPLTDDISREPLDMWCDHAYENVCGGDETLYKWLMSWFAHLIQKPGQKPLVAVVVRGDRGTGKNALVERVGALMERYFLVAADQRYLSNHFNSHLEKLLFLVLDEAFWSGAKNTHGILKNLITGKHHLIEYKGQEPFQVENFTRVAILGNEEWIVPAAQDERRYAVFEMKNGRKQDTDFFERMRLGMEAGGYAWLLRFLQEWKIDVNINVAPKTDGLRNQKIQSFDALHKWWYESLNDRQLYGDPAAEWPRRITRQRVRDAYSAYCKSRDIKAGWQLDDTTFGRLLGKMCPSKGTGKFTVDGRQVAHYLFPDLDQARLEFDRYNKCEFDWEAE